MEKKLSSILIAFVTLWLFLNNPVKVQALCSYAQEYISCFNCGPYADNCACSGQTCFHREACNANSTCYVFAADCDTLAEAKSVAGCSSSSTGTCTGSCSPNVVPDGTNWKYYSGWGRPFCQALDSGPCQNKGIICAWRNGGTSCADVNGATSSFNYDTSRAVSWECAAGWYTGGPGADCSGSDPNAKCCNTKYYNICEDQNQGNCSGTSWNTGGINFVPGVCRWYTNDECGPQHSNLASDFRASLLYQGNSECRAWSNSALSCGQAICDTACAYRDPQSAWMYSAAPASCNKVCCTPVNGTCGSANGGYFSSAPASNLCSSGAASAVSGSGPWSWTCAGSCGGSTANCSANRATSYFVTFGGDVTLKGALVNQYLPSGAYISGK